MPVAAEALERRRTEVILLNQWFAWSRGENISPQVFGDYQKHLKIHGASQNAGGDVGASGGAIAILDAISEAVPGNYVAAARSATSGWSARSLIN